MPVGCVCWGMLRPGTAALRWVAILQRGRTGGAIGCLPSLDLTGLPRREVGCSERARPRAQGGGDIDAVFVCRSAVYVGGCCGRGRPRSVGLRFYRDVAPLVLLV